jgi:hypothetical protein
MQETRSDRIMAIEANLSIIYWISPLWSIASVASVRFSQTVTPKRKRRGQPRTCQVLLQYSNPLSPPISLPPSSCFVLPKQVYTPLCEYLKNDRWK